MGGALQTFFVSPCHRKHIYLLIIAFICYLNNRESSQLLGSSPPGKPVLRSQTIARLLEKHDPQILAVLLLRGLNTCLFQNGPVEFLSDGNREL